MSINQIVTPLDSAVLETKDQYAVYFRIVQHAFDEMVRSIVDHEICNPLEVSFLEQYCELLTYSLEAFRIKYLYDEEHKMKIDLTESGFPNYLEFRYLKNDLALKHEHIERLPEVEALKKEFLRSLLRKKQAVPQKKLEQAAAIVYYSSVKQQYIFKKFVQGKIIKIENDKNTPYLVSWSFYDVSANRPFICYMYFDLYKEKLADYTQSIYEVLEQVCDRDMSLDMMAYAVDKKLPKLLPKKFKIIDLGPLHSVFAKDELEITHVILEGIVKKRLKLASHAISMSMREITSKGEFTDGNFFNKQVLQLWNEEHRQTYLMAPHRVMQALYDKIPEHISKLSKEPIEISTLKL